MKDIKKLLAIKAELETAMQGGIDPLMRVVMQRRLDVVCEEIEEARAEWDKLFDPQEISRLKKRVAELEASNAELLEALEGMLELRPDDCSSQIYKIRQKAEKAIQKARGQG